MKIRTNPFSILILAILFSACQSQSDQSADSKKDEEKNTTPSSYTYSVSLEAVDADYLAPALQSYVHAIHNGDWLLFAGRTNGNDTLGGLHNLTTDYSLNSFPPKSFNPFIYTFNPETGSQSLLNYWNMLNTIQFKAAGGDGDPEDIKAACQRVAAILENYGSIFMCSNPQAVQSGDYLYVVGGYGPPVGETPTKSNYSTFDAIAKINVPLLMRITNRDWALTATEWLDLFRFGNNSTLRCTGGELKKIGDQFYQAGGQNFNNNGQAYLNCVYQFTFSDNPGTLGLTATITDTISDVSPSELANNPKKADSTSAFRRRDLPVVPALYLDKNNALAANFALMAGVFKHPTHSSPLAAWNDAIYITPNGTAKYYIDSQYNQNNCNVYACPDFTIYDAQTTELHTFLPGGIGNGTANKQSLSPFTNTLGYSRYNLTSKASSFDTLSSIFPSSYYYGAEAEFFPNSNAKYFSIEGTETDVIDGDQTFSGDGPVHIGYIYGGIESFIASPRTYGNNKSGASNKVWKVMVSRENS